MIELFGQPMTAALLGGFGGILLGLAARLGRFCTLGAIEDLLYGGSSHRMRMWGLAIGVAIFGSFALAALNLANIDRAFYLGVHFAWAPAVVGGLIFGYGMALTGTCGFGALARLGGGDLRAFVIVLVMGLSAFAVLSGPLAPARMLLFPRSLNNGPPDGIAHTLAALTGGSVALIGMGLGLLLCLFMLAARDFRRDLRSVLWGCVAGLAVVSGWAGTAWLARNGFGAQTLHSHSYAAPVGESLLYAMQGSVRPLSFGIGSVAGVWVGAFIGSLWQGHFRWEACEDPRELRRQIFGAGLMGAGAVIAMGCTIGQGISAISVLAFSGPVTLASIVAGAALGLRQLIVGFRSNPV
ncbi:YeeE/YedE family protein [Sulfitobacter sp. S0837]|uniref:YeeE/YedE family protein n=1 Tax=Sulfitobacter maritimus TaxID=2741719 RepID=UPI001582CAEB|nr:YeeE/YedE family protein [Sulfitobacter maritimus]NUH64635.1 YeeE/YedE family protein [Sulfitobacter maritimus]